MTDSPLTSIRTRGDPVLSSPCQFITWPDPELPAAVDSLRSALLAFREAHGFGRAISAPQVGIAKRLIFCVLDNSEFVVINPVIRWRSDAMFEVWDDCLSVPDQLVRVRRHVSISLDYQDDTGQSHGWNDLTRDESELMQHEIDHLDGILMTERAIDADSIRPMSERASLVNRSN